MMVVSAERSALKKELETTAKKVVSASASRGDLDRIRADLEGLEELDPPTPRRYTTNDTSIEKMAELLMDNSDGLLLYRDELTGWLRSLERQDTRQRGPSTSSRGMATGPTRSTG
jgi:hypothetical protein